MKKSGFLICALLPVTLVLGGITSCSALEPDETCSLSFSLGNVSKNLQSRATARYPDGEEEEIVETTYKIEISGEYSTSKTFKIDSSFESMTDEDIIKSWAVYDVPIGVKIYVTVTCSYEQSYEGYTFSGGYKGTSSLYETVEGLNTVSVPMEWFHSHS